MSLLTLLLFIKLLIMSIMNPYVASGGSVDAISYPLATDVGYDKNEDVDDAIAFATEALTAIEKLQDLSLTQEKADALGEKLMNVAVESYIDRFNIPDAALESQDDDDAPKHSRLKKVILYLYAVVERIFKAVFDLFRTQKSTARQIMPLTKQYIGEVDSFTTSIATQLSIKDRSLMNALHIDGKAPKNPEQLFEGLSSTLVAQHHYNSVSEVVALIQATKDKDTEGVLREAQKLRDFLEEGFKSSMKAVSPGSSRLFNEKKSDVSNYYLSGPLFGQTYILGTVAKNISQAGTFRYSCSLQRDVEVDLRVNFFPVLTPDQIRQISRTALKICENVIRFSRDEELLQKALREATFLKTKEPDQNAVVALRNVAAIGQNSYIIHLRYTVRAMQSLMRWCAASIARYEGMKNGNG